VSVALLLPLIHVNTFVVNLREPPVAGVGVEQDHKQAVAWFKRAADQGHAHAQYNLAVAHMKDHTTLKKGYVLFLFRFQSSQLTF
jgi:hypothetical protein